MAVGSNYLYVNGKPETPSIIDLMPAWPWYLVYLEIIALALLALLYIPFLGRNKDVEAVVRDANQAVRSVGD